MPNLFADSTNRRGRFCEVEDVKTYRGMGSKGLPKKRRPVRQRTRITQFVPEGVEGRCRMRIAFNLCISLWAACVPP